MVTATQKESYDKAIQRIGELHGNLAVLSKLDAVLKDDNSGLEDAEKLIQSDGAITATIIKLSNSALFGLGEKTNTLTTALQKVGYQQTLRLVSMALSKQVFMRDLDAYGVSADQYWKYSYFTAVFMEGQADRFGFDKSQAYLLGLLHSIGRVVINELLHVDKVEMFWDRFIPEHTWENAMVGFTNEVAGSLLLKGWNFPKSTYLRVEYQSDAKKRVSNKMSALLDFARQLALNINDPTRLDAVYKSNSHPYLKQQRLSQKNLLSDIERAKVNLEETYESLEKF